MQHTRRPRGTIENVDYKGAKRALVIHRKHWYQAFFDLDLKAGERWSYSWSEGALFGVGASKVAGESLSRLLFTRGGAPECGPGFLLSYVDVGEEVMFRSDLVQMCGSVASPESVATVWIEPDRDLRFDFALNIQLSDKHLARDCC